jgi:hypothetical protein
MEVIVPIILQQLPNIVLGAEHLIAYIASVRAARMQNDEWSEADEAQFVAGLKAHGKDLAYLTDAAIAGEPHTEVGPLPDVDPATLTKVNLPKPVTPVVGTQAG